MQVNAAILYKQDHTRWVRTDDRSYSDVSGSGQLRLRHIGVHMLSHVCGVFECMCEATWHKCIWLRETARGYTMVTYPKTTVNTQTVIPAELVTAVATKIHFYFLP